MKFDNKQSKKTICLSYNHLVLIAYLYMLLPIFIFYLGWLKPIFAMPTIVLIGSGLFFLLKSEYKEKEFIEIHVASLVLIFLIIGIWVYLSGVGGFWPQMQDWHWRNAILRDLIEYTWPVIYPKTGNALVYYYNYFLPSALFGKIFGWQAANVFLSIYTWLGIIISILLIYKLLHLDTIRKAVVLVLFFTLLQGCELLRGPIKTILDLNGVAQYQYSSPETLLQWVTNQTIVPWIAVPLFLNKRRINTYIFLGMCVFSTAPLPFIGMFLFLAFDGIYQLFTDYKMRFIAWLKTVCSLANICALLGIFTVYALFFLSNTATNGSSGEGGFGLYIPLSEFQYKNFFELTTFLLYNFAFFALVILNTYKKDHIFWIMTVSLILIPLFQLGTSIDFCMRACIPAQLILIIYSLDYMVNKTKPGSSGYILMIVLLSVGSIRTYNFFFDRLNLYQNASDPSKYQADAIYSYGNKINEAHYCGIDLINFLCENPEETVFFSLLCKEKGESDSQKDDLVTEKMLKFKKFDIMTGFYGIQPVMNSTFYLCPGENGLALTHTNYETLISNSTVDGKYELYFTDQVTESDNTIIITFDENERKVRHLQKGGNQKWGTKDVPIEQLFEFVPDGNAFQIIWNNKYALTFLNETIEWTEITGKPEQLWVLAKKES